MENGWKELRQIEDFCPSSQSRTLRKKIVCTKTVYKIDQSEFSQFILSSTLIKHASNLCRKRKTTLQGVLIKKMFLGGGR